MVAWIEQGPAIPDVGGGGATATSFTDEDVHGSTTESLSQSSSANQSAGNGQTEAHFNSAFDELEGGTLSRNNFERGSTAGSTFAADSNGTTVSITFTITESWTPDGSDDPGSTATGGTEGGVSLNTDTDFESWEISCMSTRESTYNVPVIADSFFTALTVYSTTGATTVGATSVTTTTTLVITDTTEVAGTWVSLQSSTRLSEYLTTSEADTDTGGFFQRTVLMPDICNTLWVASDPMADPIAPLCEAWFTQDSFVSDADPFTTTATSDTEEGGITTNAYGWEFISDTVTDTDPPASATQGPTPLLGTYVIQVPAAVEGFQPYSAMGPSDPLYAAYDITVASTVTDTLERAARSVGGTFLCGAITEVVTLNSADLLGMHSPLGSDTTVSQDVPHGGGFGNVPGANTLRLFPGIYALTEYDAAGGSTTARSTIAESTSAEFSRGHVYAISIIDAYTQGGGLPAIFEQTC